MYSQCNVQISYMYTGYMNVVHEKVWYRFIVRQIIKIYNLLFITFIKDLLTCLTPDFMFMIKLLTFY